MLGNLFALVRLEQGGDRSGGESGQVLVVVAALMVALLGGAALAIDIGELTITRSSRRSATSSAFVGECTPPST